MRFEELTKERQDEVVEEHREFNVEFDWWEYSLENICERIKEKVDIDLNGSDLMFDFSKGHSGVWIGGSILCSALQDKHDRLEDLDISNEFGVWAYIGLRKDDIEDDDIELYEEDEDTDDLTILFQDKQDKEDVGKIKADLDVVLDIFMDGYNSLYKEYNYLTSDEGIIGNFKANGMEFDDD